MSIFCDLSLSIEEQVIFDDTQHVFISNFLLKSFVCIYDSSLKITIDLPLDIILENSDHCDIIFISFLNQTTLKSLKV
jgi:hypothetical protein